MDIDRLKCFLGKPISYKDDINIYSPTIAEIDEIGEFKYLIYLHLSCFDKEVILKELMKVDKDLYEIISDLDDYDAMTKFDGVAEFIAEALSFFTKEEVVYMKYDNGFYLKDKKRIFINKDNYKDVVKIIRKLNCMDSGDEMEGMKFKNDRVRKKYMKMVEVKKKRSKSRQVELKDCLSLLCSIEGNGINIFNVHKLTIYQVYEHLERFNIKENHRQVLLLWANTYSLKENSKLPELLVKTKL